jgi:hypothetical protein
MLGSPSRYHRKLWEWCYIAAVLNERGLLRPGATGLGFAIGMEPLPSVFAKHGVQTTATDLDPGLGESTTWAESNQHAASLEEIYWPGIVARDVFDRNVRFGYADMRATWKPDPVVDFIWSSCAFEHLGSLGAGLEFVMRSSRLLKPGGVAVHTTEYNVTSNTGTIDTGGAVIYRRCDIEELDRALRREGKCLAAMDFDPGEKESDRLADVPPYYANPKLHHVKLWLGGYVATSYGLVVVA